MSLRCEIEESVRKYLEEPCHVEYVEHPPTRDHLELGADAFQVDATALAVDIRRYSGMTVVLGRQLALKMLKAFFHGTVRLVEDSCGVVADFNGDGMIVLFCGPDRTERAFRVAAGVRWFLAEVLNPRFAGYFTSSRAMHAEIDGLDAGCGLDDGLVLLGRVGLTTSSDIVCVGRCVNAAAKLCKLARSPHGLIATYEVCDRLDDTELSSSVDWVPAGIVEAGGVCRSVLATSHELPPDVMPPLPG